MHPKSKLKNNTSNYFYIFFYAKHATYISNVILDGNVGGGLDGAGQLGNALPSATTLDLCPDCFAGKVEIGDHRSSHQYQVVIYVID